MPPELLRHKAYDHAKAWVGVTESPPGSNRGLHIDYWNGRAGGAIGGQWCAAFLFCQFLAAGTRLPIEYPPAVLSWVEWARAHDLVVGRPLRWDVVAYSWGGPTPTPADHIGIVERVLALPSRRDHYRYLIRTVEGNTGDGVRRRWRLVDPRTVAFIRVRDAA